MVRSKFIPQYIKSVRMVNKYRKVVHIMYNTERRQVSHVRGIIIAVVGFIFLLWFMVNVYNTLTAVTNNMANILN